MSAERVFIHPGFGKSETTSLQENIFSKHEQIISLGRPWNDNNFKICKQIKNLEGINYNPDAVLTLVKGVLEGHGSLNNKCIVLSDETLLSNAYMRNIKTKGGK